MQIIEVTDLWVRSSVIVMRRARGDGMRFVLYPMIHMAEPAFYEAVTEGLATADVIVSEGVRRGESRRAVILLTALTLSYRLLRFSRHAGLVRQRIDYSKCRAEVINPDVTADEFQQAWQRIPWTYRIMIWSVMPFVVLGWLLGGRQAIWSAAVELDDLPSLDDELFAEQAPEFEEALGGDRDARLLETLVRLHSERGDEAIEVAVVYGAKHIPAVVHGLHARLGYVAHGGEWLTVAHVDPHAEPFDPPAAQPDQQPRAARPPRPRGDGAAARAAKGTPPAAGNPIAARQTSRLPPPPDPPAFRRRARDAEAEVARLRPLAQEHPDVYQPRLVRALATYSDCLADVGKAADAVAPADEAVDLAEALREQNGQTYGPLYASVLSTLAKRIAGVGRHAQAAALMAEAVDVRRSSDRHDPQQRADALGPLLDEHARLLLLAGRPDGAIAPASEAAELYRQAAMDGATEWVRARALALAQLSRAHHGAGHAGRSHDAAQRAVNVARRLAARHSHEGSVLAECLRQQARVLLTAAGRQQHAVLRAEEAVEVARGLAIPASNPQLAQVLTELAGMLSDLGRRDEAVPVAAEAVSVWRAIAAGRSEYLPELAVALAEYAFYQWHVGADDYGLAAAEEAERLAGDIATTSPERAPRVLVDVHSQVSWVFRYAGQHARALAATENVLEHYRRRAAQVPSERGRLARALTDHARSLVTVGLAEEAELLREEAATLAGQAVADGGAAASAQTAES